MCSTRCTCKAGINITFGCTVWYNTFHGTCTTQILNYYYQIIIPLRILMVCSDHVTVDYDHLLDFSVKQPTEVQLERDQCRQLQSWVQDALNASKQKVCSQRIWCATGLWMNAALKGKNIDKCRLELTSHHIQMIFPLNVPFLMLTRHIRHYSFWVQIRKKKVTLKKSGVSFKAKREQ